MAFAEGEEDASLTSSEVVVAEPTEPVVPRPEPAPVRGPDGGKPGENGVAENHRRPFRGLLSGGLRRYIEAKLMIRQIPEDRVTEVIREETKGKSGPTDEK